MNITLGGSMSPKYTSSLSGFRFVFDLQKNPSYNSGLAGFPVGLPYNSIPRLNLDRVNVTCTYNKPDNSQIVMYSGTLRDWLAVRSSDNSAFEVCRFADFYESISSNGELVSMVFELKFGGILDLNDGSYITLQVTTSTDVCANSVGTVGMATVNGVSTPKTWTQSTTTFTPFFAASSSYLTVQSVLADDLSIMNAIPVDTVIKIQNSQSTFDYTLGDNVLACGVIDFTNMRQSAYNFLADNLRSVDSIVLNSTEKNDKFDYKQLLAFNRLLCPSRPDFELKQGLSFAYLASKDLDNVRLSGNLKSANYRAGDFIVFASGFHTDQVIQAKSMEQKEVVKGRLQRKYTRSR